MMKAKAKGTIPDLPDGVGTVGGLTDFTRSLRHWINDALMTFFFFLVALELKRELVLGELNNPRMAALSIAAAWVLSLGIDLFLHGGLLAHIYLEPSPFLLPAEDAFRRIPLGYLTFLILTIALFWLLRRLQIQGFTAGFRLAAVAGAVIWGALVLGVEVRSEAMSVRRLRIRIVLDILPGVKLRAILNPSVGVAALLAVLSASTASAAYCGAASYNKCCEPACCPQPACCTVMKFDGPWLVFGPPSHTCATDPGDEASNT